jgi:hypothetical protein
MAIFPDSTSIKPLVDGFQSGFIENVRRNPAEAGNTQIRDVWGGATKFFSAFRMKLNSTNANIVIAFWQDNRALTFTFFDFDNSIRYYAESIGTGDGVTRNFTVAGKEISSQAVSDNGVLKIAGTHYNVSAGSGALGEDRIIFTPGNAPALGHAVLITYTGRHLYNCDLIEFGWEMANSMGAKLFTIRVEEAF